VQKVSWNFAGPGEQKSSRGDNDVAMRLPGSATSVVNRGNRGEITA